MKEETAENHITIGDVLRNTGFQNILRKRIWGLQKYTTGQYKSNPAKTLEQKGLLRVEHFILQFPLILAKTCKLSSQERAVIDSEVWTSIREWQINNENNKNHGSIAEQGVPDNGVVA